MEQMQEEYGALKYYTPVLLPSPSQHSILYVDWSSVDEYIRWCLRIYLGLTGAVRDLMILTTSG